MIPPRFTSSWQWCQGAENGQESASRFIAIMNHLTRNQVTTFSSAVSSIWCLQLFPVCSPQHHSLTNSGHDSCPDWGKEPCYCYMRFAKCNGRSSEGWNTEQILFAVRKQDWKNSAVKTSMTKHETATAANEVCLVNSTVSSVMLREMLALAAH